MCRYLPYWYFQVPITYNAMDNIKCKSCLNILYLSIFNFIIIVIENEDFVLIKLINFRNTSHHKNMANLANIPHATSGGDAQWL